MDAMREGVGGDRGDMMSKNQNLPELYSVSTTHLIPRGTVTESEQGEYEQEGWDMWELCTGSAHSFEHGHVRIIIFKTRQRNPLFCPLSINPT